VFLVSYQLQAKLSSGIQIIHCCDFHWVMFITLGISRVEFTDPPYKAGAYVHHVKNYLSSLLKALISCYWYGKRRQVKKVKRMRQTKIYCILYFIIVFLHIYKCAWKPAFLKSSAISVLNYTTFSYPYICTYILYVASYIEINYQLKDLVYYAGSPFGIQSLHSCGRVASV